MCWIGLIVLRETYSRDIYFEALDINPANSSWRFVEDPFVLFVKEVLHNAEAEKG